MRCCINMRLSLIGHSGEYIISADRANGRLGLGGLGGGVGGGEGSGGYREEVCCSSRLARGGLKSSKLGPGGGQGGGGTSGEGGPE